MASILHPHPFFVVALNLSLICILFTDSLFVALFPLMFCIFSLFTATPPHLFLHLSLTSHYESLFLSVSLLQVFDSHTVVIWLLFYFNLTLLFRNRHPHALAIVLALYSLFSSPGSLPCLNFYHLLRFYLQCS